MLPDAAQLARRERSRHEKGMPNGVVPIQMVCEAFIQRNKPCYEVIHFIAAARCRKVFFENRWIGCTFKEIKSAPKGNIDTANIAIRRIHGAYEPELAGKRKMFRVLQIDVPIAVLQKV